MPSRLEVDLVGESIEHQRGQIGDVFIFLKAIKILVIKKQTQPLKIDYVKT